MGEVPGYSKDFGRNSESPRHYKSMLFTRLSESIVRLSGYARAIAYEQFHHRHSGFRRNPVA